MDDVQRQSEGGRGNDAVLEKGRETQVWSARQVLILAPQGSELRGLCAQALRVPQYVLRVVDNVAEALRALAETKVEVLLFEPEAEKTRSPQVLSALQLADPDAEIILFGRRLHLAVIMAAMNVAADSSVDLLGAPLSIPELVRGVERARERRFLRRAEQRRQRVEARMTAVVKGVPMGVISFDTAGTIHDWNPGACAIFGRREQEAIGRSFWDVVTPGLDITARQSLVVGNDATPRRKDINGTRSDGSSFVAVVSVAPMPYGDRTMYCAIVEDVTEARRMEIELRHAQKLEALGRIASGLAHELNTPCQFISDNATFLQQGGEDLWKLLDLYEKQTKDRAPDEDLDEIAQFAEEADLDFLRENEPKALAAIRAGVDRIASIVAAMKDLARPEQRGTAPVDLNRALMGALALLRTRIEAAADLDLHLGSVPEVPGQPADLGQVFYSLILNAIQAIEDRRETDPRRGIISVATRLEACTVRISIGDDGVGISEEIQSHIFDPFFTTRVVGSGVGQGLTVARAVIVDRHGGSLSFSSRVGQGTEFVILLPCSAPDHLG